MSIVQLDRVTFVGLTEGRERLLQDLQELGCLHIEPFVAESESQNAVGTSAGAREALQFLHACPQRRRQIRDAARFDALETERKVLDVRQRLQMLSDERDFLVKRIQDMRPWGDFEFSPLPEMGGLRLWFYTILHRDLVLMRDLPLVHEIVKKDSRYCYVVVISENEPDGMPFNRTHIGSQPRHELEVRLEEVELAIEDVQAERAYKRFYPAIDLLLSWSRYLDQLAPWFTKELNAEWVNDVKNMMTLLERGDGIYQIMQVTGEEGITLEDFIEWQKSMLLDMVYLQQDAFDEVDACMPRERQLASFKVLKNWLRRNLSFRTKTKPGIFLPSLPASIKTGITAVPIRRITRATARTSNNSPVNTYRTIAPNKPQSCQGALP